MSLIVLASASGAPGVTTTALGLALSWPRPVVLVDADPVGGSPILAGYFQGRVEHPDAMVRLVLALREQRLGEALPSVLVPLAGSASLLTGPRSGSQATSLRELWGPLARELQSLGASGQDVVVDLGRLGMASSAVPLLEAADCALLVVRSDLPAVSACRQWGQAWAVGAEAGTSAPVAACVPVGPGRPYRASEVAAVVGLPVLESVPWQEREAAVLSQGLGGFGRRSRLERAFRALGESIRQAVASTALTGGGVR